MKKRYTVLALLSTMAMVLTGCSWDEMKAKFVGDDSSSVTGSAVAEGAVDIEEYKPSECITLGEYKGIEVDCRVTDEELQQQTDNMLMQYSTVEQIKKGKCKSGQSVNIDYTGEVDNKEVDGETAQDEMIQLGSSGHIDGFDDGIAGMKPGEKKELQLTFPSDYANSELAGKKVVYTITLNYIAGETKTPKLTEAFLKKNTSFKTVKEYKEETKKALKEQKKNNAVNTALQTIVNNTETIRIPDTLKQAHKSQTDHSYRYNLQQYYGSDTDFETILGSMGMTAEIYDQQMDAAAEESAKMQIVIEAIAEKENFACTDADVTAYLNEVISGAGASASKETFEKQYLEMYGNAISFDDFLKTSCIYQKATEIIQNSMIIKE